jgi:hypothetical protein
VNYKNLICLLSILAFFAKGQNLEKNKSYYISAIGFWNVENLYDTLNDEWKNDEDFTPKGANAWNGKRYWIKIDRLSETISGIATDVTPDGLAILGLCEIENKKVVLDIVASKRLKNRNYQVVHVEGPDARGVDPALIYNPVYFKLMKVVSYHVNLVTDSSHKTRDILVVSGTFLGEPLSILVNHWPSRRGGELASRPNRNAAAKIARHIADSINIQNKAAKIIIMGDLNDDPLNECVKKHIGTYGDIHQITKDNYFNPMEKLYLNGIGTLAWQDSWSLFDQIILNRNWVPMGGTAYNTWQFYKAKIYNKDFLKNEFGNYRGYPFRTYSGGTYTGGYSDHFPSFIVIAKEKE